MENTYKVVIKRHGLVILRENQVSLVSHTPYLSVADGALNQVLDNEKVTHTYNEHVASELKVTVKCAKVEEVFHSFASDGLAFNPCFCRSQNLSSLGSDRKSDAAVQSDLCQKLRDTS